MSDLLMLPSNCLRGFCTNFQSVVKIWIGSISVKLKSTNFLDVCEENGRLSEEVSHVEHVVFFITS